MTRFVAITEPKSASPNIKYVKQTYDAMTNSAINLEAVALQISQLPVREQQKFFRLLLNYIDVTANNTMPTMKDIVELCNKLINVTNNHYEQLEIQYA